RTDLSGSVVGGKIYVIGGDVGNAIVATVEVYDPATNTSTTAPEMPTARVALRTSVVDGKIYAMGGLTGWFAAACRTVEEYAPPLVVDFNGDFKVDFKDFSILAQCWFGGESSADIAAGLLGEQSLDYEDLADLAEYWLVEFGLVAHWKLDEIEGGIAVDSIGGKDGYGAPDLLWRPEAGKVGGALELDGIDDFLFTTFSLNPAQTSFGVFTWIKGGAPGQVIVSQAGGADWLCADPSGNLMTGLCEPAGGRVLPEPLVSEFVITDGDWHRVGFTWDGSGRALYVDDVEVARDKLRFGLASSEGSLHIGAGSNLEAGSHWFGIIDDVRIYDRAILP
ncbi:MAG: hypothetical protein JSU70_03490, partial [Phycisphaerales bacterium]